jgi:hypothetical protein
MRLEMAGEMPNSAAMRADCYGGSTSLIVKPGISPGFGLTGANFIRGSIATAGHLPRSRTQLLRVVNLSISATNTDPSWGVVVMLFSLRVHTCLPTTRARRVFRPAALADGEPFLPMKSVDAIDA